MNIVQRLVCQCILCAFKTIQTDSCICSEPISSQFQVKSSCKRNLTANEVYYVWENVLKNRNGNKFAINLIPSNFVSFSANMKMWGVSHSPKNACIVSNAMPFVSSVNNSVFCSVQAWREENKRQSPLNGSWKDGINSYFTIERQNLCVFFPNEMV